MMALVSCPPIAYMSFDFMFPNISTPSLEKNLLSVFLLSTLVGMPVGYGSRRTDAAVVTVVLYVTVGYLVGAAAYSTPYMLYGLELILPGFYYSLYFRFTILLVFLYVLGGFIGAILGQVVKDSIRREETKATWD